MEIGVVVHGPGIIDSGWAMKIIDYLSNYGNVRCRLGGTMGRTAVIDAGLENIINISMKLLPSESLEIFNTENVDVLDILHLIITLRRYPMKTTCPLITSLFMTLTYL